MHDKLAKRQWLSFLRMQESIEYSIVTEIVFRRMSGISKFHNSIPHIGKLRTYENYTINNNFAEFWICIIRTPPQPSPKEGVS
jgi:hypothetical protein